MPSQASQVVARKIQQKSIAMAEKKSCQESRILQKCNALRAGFIHFA
jgi:hypothetical protein